MIRPAAVAVAFLLALTACSSCSHAPIRTPESQAIEDLMSSTVRVRVSIDATLHTHRKSGPLKGKPVELAYHTGWTGSGVVVAKTGGLLEKEMSTILTANHVLEAPDEGDRLQGPDGDEMVIESVKMEIDTYTGQQCELTPIVMGTTDERDVATAYANCDAGRVAEVADRVPPPGAKVLTTGHPNGTATVITTEGYVSGWRRDKYLCTSIPIYPGNSGGALWYEGKVVGIMVRVDEEWAHISLSVPLKEIQERIEATP